MTSPILVVGSGLAGWTCVRELRKQGSTAPLTLVTADAGDFYAKPTLSNAFAQRRGPAQLVTTAARSMAESCNVTLLCNTRVQSIDCAAQCLQTDQGRLDYHQLVLASGAQPIRVPLQGDAAGQVLSINSLDDFSRFYARLTGTDSYQNKSIDRPPRVLIMGAGLIGCEFANDLVGVGCRVDLVDPGARALAALLPEAASTALQTALSELGVNWHFGQSVVAVQQAGAALEVTLSGGARLAADVVLSAIGLRADTALAQAAGIVCERGIVVDAQLRTSQNRVFALGDAAQYQVAGNRTLPFVMPIMQAARVLAATLAGQDAALRFGLMPVAIKTPALPLLVAAPAPGSPGGWVEQAAGVWAWQDDAGVLRGFALAGAATAKRGQWTAALAST